MHKMLMQYGFQISPERLAEKLGFPDGVRVTPFSDLDSRMLNSVGMKVQFYEDDRQAVNDSFKSFLETQRPQVVDIGRTLAGG